MASEISPFQQVIESQVIMGELGAQEASRILADYNEAYSSLKTNELNEVSKLGEFEFSGINYLMAPAYSDGVWSFKVCGKSINIPVISAAGCAAAVTAGSAACIETVGIGCYSAGLGIVAACAPEGRTQTLLSDIKRAWNACTH